MKQRIICKALAVAVIVLFLGLAIQPSVAVKTNTSDSDDDCIICPKVSNQHLVRLKSIADILEKHDDRIETLKEMNVESNSDEYPRICLFLVKLLNLFVSTLFLVTLIGNLLRATGHEIVYLISSILSLPILVLLYIPPLLFFGVFDCWDWFEE